MSTNSRSCLLSPTLGMFADIKHKYSYLHIALVPNIVPFLLFMCCASNSSPTFVV